jgi:hypothetical protein
MSTNCPLPLHPHAVEAQVDEASRKIPLHCTQHHACSTRSGKGSEAPQHLVRDIGWYLGIDRSKPLQQSCGHLWPDLAISTTNHEKALRGDPCLPRNGRTEPSPSVEDCDRLRRGSCGYE